MLEITLDVEGMTCHHCKMTVEKAVKALDGIHSAEVNLEEKNVTIHYDQKKVDIPHIKEAIENSGYHVVP